MNHDFGPHFVFCIYVRHAAEAQLAELTCRAIYGEARARPSVVRSYVPVWLLKIQNPDLIDMREYV